MGFCWRNQRKPIIYFMSRRFLPVKGFEKKYAINEWGTLRNVQKKIMLANFIGRGGYKFVVLRGGKDKRKIISVHRLVATAFIQNPENKPFVNHIDGNKLNNRVANLEWCTPKENVHHAIKSGLRDSMKGVDNIGCKLMPESVMQILNRPRPYKAICKEFGVSLSAVNKIKSGAAWSSITGLTYRPRKISTT